MGQRRKSRELVLQTLYSFNFSNNVIENYIKKFREIREENSIKKDNPITEFALELLKGTLLNIKKIDINIKKYSKNWKFDRIALMEKGILRLAIYELLFTSTNKSIVINEALELTKKYCAKNAVSFVNGILNSVGESL